MKERNSPLVSLLKVITGLGCLLVSSPCHALP